MPEDSKKNHEKKKGDPKEQRRPRQRHQQSEKKTEEPKNVPKVTVPQKPVYENPPPEFYKNLKRETDEILKITEEETSKYKKKEIQSNWSKYEMPIESYDEIEDHENLGADYEKLIQTPLSIGGHFQFKHEKSWDMDAGPSVYDKYFEINMEDLNTALCSIPFYERNSIEEDNFSQTDILTMNSRATRFKQKYYNDKTYSTPETEAHDKILNLVRDSIKEDKVEREKDISHEIDIQYDKERKTSETDNATNIHLEFKTEIKTEPTNVEENVPKHEAEISKTELIKTPSLEQEVEHEVVFGDTSQLTKETAAEKDPVLSKTPGLTEKLVCHVEETPVVDKVASVVAAASAPKVAATPTVLKVSDTPAETKRNQVIESPEDLEKWLDDFLDG